MVNFGPLAAEIDPVVWGIPANFNGFRILAALLHGTLVVGATCMQGRSHRGGRVPHAPYHVPLHQNDNRQFVFGTDF